MTDKTETLPRIRRARLHFAIGLGLSAAVGLLIGISGRTSGGPTITDDWLSFQTIPPAVAAIAMAVILAVFGLSIRWWRTIDEHEAAAYRSGAMWGGHFYLTASCTWYVAWAGGLAPEPDGMLMLLAVSLVWTAVWLWRRYR